MFYQSQRALKIYVNKTKQHKEFLYCSQTKIPLLICYGKHCGYDENTAVIYDLLHMCAA